MVCSMTLLRSPTLMPGLMKSMALDSVSSAALMIFCFSGEIGSRARSMVESVCRPL